MRIDCSAEELALLQSRAFRPYLRAFVADADGTWQDTSSLQGISHLYDVTVDIDIDNKVSSFQLHLRRDAGPTRSLSPFRTDSILNRNADDEFASLLDAGRDVYAQVGVGAPGSTAPLAWHTIAVGTIDSVDLAGAIVVAQCRDQGAVLADTYTPQQDHYLYVDPVTLLGTPAPLQNVIERILQNSNVGLSAIRVLGDPSYVIQNFEVNVEPVLDPVLRLAQLPGWDFRWLWSNTDGEFLPTLYDPEREKVIPDLVLDPSQYIEVKECAIDRTNVRNEILIQFGSAVNRSRRIPRSLSDAQSISRYHRKTLLITEATNGPIKTEAEADAMLGFVLSDLKDPIASLQLVMFPFWPVELHDLVRCTANGQHFNTDVDLAVTKIRHQFGGDKPRTTLFLRGNPAAYYRGWVRRARVPVTPSSDREADVDEYLEDVRVERVSATQARITWTRAEGVAYVFAYAETLAATEAFPAPTETPTILSVGTDELLVALPAPGQRTFVQLEPRDEIGSNIVVLGGVRRLTIDPMGEVVGYTYGTEEPFEGTGRVTITLEDSGGFVHTTQKIRFRKTLLGVTTEHAASTAPAGTTTSGTYTFDLLLDAKHPTMVEAFWIDTEGGERLIGSWTFDSDKQANVTATAAYADAVATITARCDTDTAVGADTLEYRVHGGAWTPVAVPSDRVVSFDLALSETARQTVELRAKNSAGSYGPTFPLEVSQYIPASAPTTQCRAAISAATATTVTVTVTAVAPSGTPTVQLVDVTGSAALSSGPAEGVASPSGTVWVFNRGAFESGPGQAQFRSVLAGHVSDDDFVEIPEQGRDTVALSLEAKVIATAADTIDVRITPIDPLGTASIAIANDPSATIGGVAIIAGATPVASGGSIDYRITRPAAGAAPGRVVFTGTATSRVRDLDAVDVPAKETDYSIPTLEITPTRTSTTTSIAFTSSGTVEYRVDSGAWTAAGAGPVVIARNAAGGADKSVLFRATGSNGRTTTQGPVNVPAQEGTPTQALLYGLELAIYSDTSDEIEASFLQQGAIDHIHVVWWVLEYSPGTKTTAAANAEVFVLTGYDIVGTGSGNDEITVMAYVVGHDSSHNVVAVSNTAELRRVPIQT